MFSHLKVRDQSSMLREQRNAIAKTQTQSSQTSMKVRSI